jgi:hypothetical protein
MGAEIHADLTFLHGGPRFQPFQSLLQAALGPMQNKKIDPDHDPGDYERGEKEKEVCLTSPRFIMSQSRREGKRKNQKKQKRSRYTKPPPHRDRLLSSRTDAARLSIFA